MGGDDPADLQPSPLSLSYSLASQGVCDHWVSDSFSAETYLCSPQELSGTFLQLQNSSPGFTFPQGLAMGPGLDLNSILLSAEITEGPHYARLAHFVTPKLQCYDLNPTRLWTLLPEGGRGRGDQV